MFTTVLLLLASAEGLPSIPSIGEGADAVGGHIYKPISDRTVRFQTKIYQQLEAGTNTNLMISSMDLYSILGVLRYGADGPTAEQITAVIDLPSFETFVRILGELLPLYASANFEEPVAFANFDRTIYVSNRYQIQKRFENIARLLYLPVANIDFSNPYYAASVINERAADLTNDVVKLQLEAHDIYPDTNMVIVSSVFVKGPFSVHFDPVNTRIEDFYLTTGRTVQVPIMHTVGRFNYFEDAALGVQILEIPCGENKEGNLVIVLPRKFDGLSELSAHINATYSPKFKSKKVKLSLPRFQIDTYWRHVEKTLENLGIDKVFHKGANLSGIGGDPGELFVSTIVQRGYIRVNEAGILQPAAEKSEDDDEDEFEAQFIANRPFLFYLKRRGYGFIAYQGRLVDPRITKTIL